MTVNSGSIAHDTTLILRAILASGTADPLSATRPSTSKFVLTSYPQRPAFYPIITVKVTRDGESRRLGTQTQTTWVPLRAEVRVWGRTTEEMDNLADKAFNALKTSQMSGTNAWIDTQQHGLWDFKQLSEGTIQEDGVSTGDKTTGGIAVHSKIMEFRYNFIDTN